MATHSSVLAWRIPWTEEPGRLQSIGSQSQTCLQRLSSSIMSKLCLPFTTENNPQSKRSFYFQFLKHERSDYCLFPKVFSHHSLIPDGADIAGSCPASPDPVRSCAPAIGRLQSAGVVTHRDSSPERGEEALRDLSPGQQGNLQWWEEVGWLCEAREWTAQINPGFGIESTDYQSSQMCAFHQGPTSCAGADVNSRELGSSRVRFC